MSISIVGLGNIGLPLSILIANQNIKVNGYDKNKYRLSEIKKLRRENFEKDIFTLLNKPIVKKNFSVSNNLEKNNTYIICVPTPIKYKKNKKVVDLYYLNQALKEIEKILEPNNLVIIESTVPMNTCLKIEKKLNKKIKIYVSHTPERAFPGKTIYEMIYNNRIIGSNSKNSLIKTKKIYKKFVKGKIINTDFEIAECSKLAENIYRDVNIALANELHGIFSASGLNSKKIFEIANNHPRVNIHNYGIGVGGHCIPVDPYFIKDFEKTKLIKFSRKINDTTTNKYINKITKIINTNKNKRIVLLGLTYKADTIDFRNSPALKIFKSLLNLKKVYAYDPFINNKIFKSNKLIDTKNISNKDLLIPLVKHEVIKKILLKRKKQIINLI